MSGVAHRWFDVLIEFEIRVLDEFGQLFTAVHFAEIEFGFTKQKVMLKYLADWLYKGAFRIILVIKFVAGFEHTGGHQVDIC